MESFLTTLPPYVHAFLAKHPPTDVFNLLRELICFAVLYSDDRARIQSSTEALIKKKLEQVESEEEKEEEEAVVPESHTIESIKEETEPETKEVVVVKETKPMYNIRTGELIQTDKSIMPNTFPQWWGDEGGKHEASAVKHNTNSFDKNKPYGRYQEDEPDKKHDIVKTIPVQQKEPKTEAYGSSWISWDDTPAKNNPHRLERARSQIIPNLRSYPSEDNARTAANSHTSPAMAAASLKRHSTLNLRSSVSPPTRATSNSPVPRTNSTLGNNSKSSKRLSAPVCESPTTGTQSKFVLTATKQQKAREADTASIATSDTVSRSTTINKPRPNAAMRARAEHARQQKLELEQKKKNNNNNTPIVSSHSLRLKERVKSGIDWDTIKKERRNTIAEETVTKK